MPGRRHRGAGVSTPPGAGTPPSHVVVVGASAAGLSVCEGLRRLDYRGRLTLIGDEPHVPYDRPPLSKQLLAGAWEPERLHLRDQRILDELDLDLRLGARATGLDTTGRQVELADGERVGYDQLVIATGTRARRLPGTEGISGVHVLRTLDDALALRDNLRGKPRLVVVGGGFVGAEAAAVARELGCDVTLVTDTAMPLADVLGPELGAMLTAVHTEHGVRVQAGVRVDRITSEDGRVTGVRLADGRTLTADAVLVGIGAVPNTEWLAGSGVPVDNGVLCDTTLSAGDGVWAAGDIASWPAPDGQRWRIEHRTNAAEQGLLVARNILAGPGAASAFTTVPYVWSDQYDLKIQIYGRPRGADHIRLVEGDVAGRKLVALYGKDGAVCAAVGVNMIRAARTHRAQVAAAAPWEPGTEAARESLVTTGGAR
ncbi:NAD(P)/FAD-dependent oxidoreductase [Streptomyces sp. NPDC088725]|uniref:NAD(P)/FAD-dependent oxidoreductase n=1 Tax=Streptomyces sp. NPDC088725 TaxID=3365873 RepID=UPI003826DBB3